MYAVVFHKDMTMVATVVGPFRSEEKANAACEKMDRLYIGEDFDDGTMETTAYVVLLETVKEALNGTD